ncbi:hypothetical protein EW146_g9251 [Bondarzewia mesenterica]|uniref:Uncharacterized protein n=1 Tax=Bondarzewia mesenterica TaxID=1095465 RepID=A0A4S4L8A3_9AGAM|nr:hypothetical protein EW146_g9251 [Bondarzewia mesenterica]
MIISASQKAETGTSSKTDQSSGSANKVVESTLTSMEKITNTPETSRRSKPSLTPSKSKTLQLRRKFTLLVHQHKAYLRHPDYPKLPELLDPHLGELVENLQESANHHDLSSFKKTLNTF